MARIARYAWGDDYHEVVLRRLNALWLWMRKTHPDPFEAMVYVDTGPIQERVYAQHAGIGWIGKHTCVISAKRGSWIFLSTILCSLPLDPDPPATDHCGTCTKCLEACPTGAIVEPYVLDARRCLSYLTIEQKKAIPDAHADAAGAYVYGCDICQDVCPWNQAPLVSSEPQWLPRPALDAPRLVDLWRKSDAELAEALTGSAMTRAPLASLRRNLAIALGNATDRRDARRARRRARRRAAVARPRRSSTRRWRAAVAAAMAERPRSVTAERRRSVSLSAWPTPCGPASRRRSSSRCRSWSIRTSTGRSCCCASTTPMARSVS